MKRSRHAMSVEEHVQSKKKEYPPKKKLATIRTELLDDFKKLDLDENEVYLFNNEETVKFLEFPRKVKLIDIILRIFDTEFLDKLIESNIKNTTSNELPPIFHNPKEKSKRRDYVKERRKLVFKYFATRLLILSSHKSNLRSNWPLEFPGGKYVPLGIHTFQQMLSNFMIRLDCVGELNRILMSICKVGRIVNLDEKHKGCSKDYHLTRWVHGKEPNWGHWNTELCVISPKFGLPLVICMMPLTSTKPQNVTIERDFNNFTLLDVHKEIHKYINKETIIVEDAYYLDNASRNFLREKEVHYLSAMSTSRFSEIWDECKKHVKNPGDWVILYNDKTEEHAMMQWDPVREKKFYVLSNAFRNRKYPNVTSRNIKSKKINVIWETYQFLFNGCDRFNHFLANKYWPYARWGWQSNYDDFYFTSLVMNIYVIYHELTLPEKQIKWKSFTLMLAESLFEHVL